MNRSILLPLMAEPVSSQVSSPRVGMSTTVPGGSTLGSQAIVLPSTGQVPLEVGRGLDDPVQRAQAQ